MSTRSTSPRAQKLSTGAKLPSGCAERSTFSVFVEPTQRALCRFKSGAVGLCDLQKRS